VKGTAGDDDDVFETDFTGNRREKIVIEE